MKKSLLIKLLTLILSLCTVFCFAVGCDINDVYTEPNDVCTEHVEQWIVDEQATCTEQGVKHAQCEKCGYFMGLKFIEATGHDFVDNTCRVCTSSYGTEGLSYTINAEKTGYIVTGVGMADESDIVIPSTYKGLPVVSIADIAFSGEETVCAITSVSIPDSVTSIGRKAFCSCSSLTNVTISNSVTSIGEYAFYGCESLTFNVKGGLKYLGNESNKYVYLVDVENKSITTATIDSNCRVITSDVFSNCDSLTSVTIPNNVTSIGDYVFSNCDSLTSVTIPNSVTSIGRYAFSNCNLLETIYCEAESQPSGWDSSWNENCSANVVWGYKG